MRARAIEFDPRTLTRRSRWSIVLVAVAVAFAGQLMPETTKAATLVDVPDSAVEGELRPEQQGRPDAGASSPG